MAGKNETSVGVKFTADATGFERVVSSMMKSVKGMETTLKGIGLNQALELGKKGWESYEKIMNSTEGTADKLEMQIATLDGAMGGLVKTIATGSWEKLFSNIINTTEATRELTRATDDFQHILAGTYIKRGRLSLDFQEARVNAGESTNPEDKKKYLQEAIDLRRELTVVEVEEIQKRLGITENYYRKVTGHEKEYFNYFLEQVPKLAQEYDYYFGENSVVLEGAKKRISDLDYVNRVTVGSITEAQIKERHELQLLVYVLEDYIKIQDDFSKKGQWDEYVRGIGDMSMAAASGEKALLRLVKQLEDAKKKVEATKFSKSGVPLVSSTGSGSVIGQLALAKNDKAKLSKDNVPEMLGNLQLMQNLVTQLDGNFQALFTNVGGGFKGMVAAMMDSIKMMLAQLAGKAALFGLLQLLFPGSGMAVGALTNLRKFVGIPGFASGTNFAPGGMALVGERGPEIVNLPRGSQVIPNNAMGGTVLIKFQNGSLQGYLDYQNRKAGSYG